MLALNDRDAKLVVGVQNLCLLHDIGVGLAVGHGGQSAWSLLQGGRLHVSRHGIILAQDHQDKGKALFRGQSIETAGC